MNTDSQVDAAVEDGTVAVEVKVDYAAMPIDQLRLALRQACEVEDWKLVGKLSALLTKAEAAVEAAKKTALQAELAVVTQSTRALLTGLIDLMAKGEAPDQEAIKALIQQVKTIMGSELVGADGVWFAVDFGSVREVGINPACRLVKVAKRPTKEGSTASQTPTTCEVKTDTMLAEVGSEVMYAEDKVVTIDHIEQAVAAGTTYQQAYDKSTNGNWRFKVRMALLKKTSRV